MGFNFRKSIKIMPGVRLNISKSGVSTTVGGGGASMNLKRGRKTKVTVGAPGSGVSYTHHLENGPNSEDHATPASNLTSATGGHGWILWVLAIFVFVVLVKILR